MYRVHIVNYCVATTPSFNSKSPAYDVLPVTLCFLILLCYAHHVIMHTFQEVMIGNTYVCSTCTQSTTQQWV